MLLTIAELATVLCWACVCTGTSEPTCSRAASLSSTITCGADKTLIWVTADSALITSRTPLASTKPGKLLPMAVVTPPTVIAVLPVVVPLVVVVALPPAVVKMPANLCPR